jgi:hypothetical protein
MIKQPTFAVSLSEVSRRRTGTRCWLKGCVDLPDSNRYKLNVTIRMKPESL